MTTFPPGAFTTDDASLLKSAQVLGDGLSGEWESIRKLNNGAGLAIRQCCDKSKARDVSKGCEYIRLSTFCPTQFRIRHEIGCYPFVPSTLDHSFATNPRATPDVRSQGM